MTRPPELHLAPDDVDALLHDEPGAAVAQHLEHCADCRLLLRDQRRVAESIEALPLFAPSDEFADQVMFQVAVPDPFAMRSMATVRHRLLGNPRARAMAAASLIVMVGAMAASVIWTAAHREVLQAAGSWLGGEASQWFWVALRGTFANITEQPWFEPARRVLGGPARLALLSAGAMLLYAGGLMALRRLMALPSQGVAHAGA